MSMMTQTAAIPKASVMLKRGLAGLAALLLVACQSTAPDDLLLDSQTTSLIFVKSNTSGTLDNNFIGGGNTSDLYMLTPISPNGQLKNLTVTWTDGSAAVADPEIFHDGLKVIFSMRKKAAIISIFTR